MTPGWRERGMVTAETATVLPLLIALTLSLGWLISLGVAQVRCLDAAREAARLVARGDAAEARVVAQQAAPGGADVTIADSGDLVTVTVSVQARAQLPLLAQLPAIEISASAVSAVEGADGS